MREKTKVGIMDHICKLKCSDEYLLIGSSHVERLVWKFPHLAPAKTWLCGIGGDRAFEMSYRVHNETKCGYTQHRNVRNDFKVILVMIGGNDILPERMPKEDIVRIFEYVDTACKQLTKRWPNAEVKVLPILPVPVTGTERNQENFREYNQLLLNSGWAKCGASFAWDLDLDTDFEDDVHLNECGYRKFTKQIKVFLETNEC